MAIINVRMSIPEELSDEMALLQKKRKLTLFITVALKEYIKTTKGKRDFNVFTGGLRSGEIDKIKAEVKVKKESSCAKGNQEHSNKDASSAPDSIMGATLQAAHVDTLPQPSKLNRFFRAKKGSQK